jgi:RNA polymerase sigma-70 factor (ECF subfamily)
MAHTKNERQVSASALTGYDCNIESESAAGEIAIGAYGEQSADLSQADDRELAAMSAKADMMAFSELVKRHQRAVYSIVSRMVDNPMDTDDVVQDVFVLAYRSIGKFRGEASFATWIYRIAVNTAIKHLKKAKLMQTDSIEDSNTGLDLELSTGDGESLTEIIVEEERKKAVRDAVESLPEKHRTVVLLRYFEDYSCEEIAKIMGCSVGTVWSRLYYACRRLKEQLKWLETA